MEKWSSLILNNLCLPCLLPVPFTLMTVLTLIYINLQCKSVTLDWFQDQIALKSNKNTSRHKSFAMSNDRIHTRAWTNCMLLAVISLWFYWTHLFNIALLLTGKMWKYFQFFFFYTWIAQKLVVVFPLTPCHLPVLQLYLEHFVTLLY